MNQSVPVPNATPSVKDVELAVGQYLALAKSANVSFELINGRLMLRGAKVKWSSWGPVRQCLDEIGIGAIEEYFRRTTAVERTELSAIPDL